jgi:hypothetical protein
VSAPRRGSSWPYRHSALRLRLADGSEGFSDVLQSECRPNGGGRVDIPVAERGYDLAEFVDRVGDGVSDGEFLE